MANDVPNAHVAQLVEHVLGKDEVTRSIRVVGSTPSLVVPRAIKWFTASGIGALRFLGRSD
jgi:hypothetical protein